jgi:DNA polymerase-1
MDISSPCFDIEIVAYLIDPSWDNFDLFKIGLKYFPQEYIELMNLVDFEGRKLEGLNFKEKNELISLYCGYLYRLYPELSKEIAKLKLIKLYKEIEEPLIFVLAEMEYKGIKVDVDYLKELSGEYEKKMNKLIEEIFNISGKNFNINSPKQLSQILYNELKLKPLKKTKTGLSTDEESLRFLSQQHPLPNLILEYRELAKLKSTYIDNILNLVDKKDSKIHASFNQSVTQTGRLSSSNPNLQNIPVRSELGRMVRKAFIPSKNNYCFVSADYSQIELRILAHFSKDEKLLDAFIMGKDIHRHTASLIFGVSEDLVSEQMRSIAKTVNFGIIYGISGYGLSRQLDLPQEEAAKFIKNYFELYPGVKSFIEEQIALVRETEVVETLMGRRRKIPEINSSDINLREFGERLAINTPIQGTAADIIKKAMVDIYKEIKENNWQVNLLIQIHDELLFEVSESEKEDFKKRIKKKMEEVINLSVPLVVNLKEGKNWLEMG